MRAADTRESRRLPQNAVPASTRKGREPCLQVGRELLRVSGIRGGATTNHEIDRWQEWEEAATGVLAKSAAQTISCNRGAPVSRHDDPELGMADIVGPPREIQPWRALPSSGVQHRLDIVSARQPPAPG